MLTNGSSFATVAKCIFACCRKEAASMDVAAAKAHDALVSVRNVTLAFGGVVALNDVSFDIPRGGILGLIGPNGAGKTSLFNCLSRLYTPRSGDILLEGQSILRRKPHELATLGLARGFQNLALFRRLSVLDNIRIGGHSTISTSLLSDLLGFRGARRQETELEARAWDVATRLGLATHAFTPAGSLSFGLQKRIELARALMARPKLLMLDEPAGGLNHSDVGDLGSLIESLRDDWGVTVLLVEHHMGLVMSVADRVVVLDFGVRIAEGMPGEVRNNPEVITAYLGTGSVH
jgi:branched-chain amino acid transport system ATP-binding protein